MSKLKAWWDSVCIFHAWEKWEPYVYNYTSFGDDLPPGGVDGKRVHQRRTCKRCGKMQDKRV